ncbi:Hypothetical protein D9617_10g071880 [Elsinoe fawcettii]|nr:Hypothetical protein D9617_10g071880 [Elsinoe fawcettii]
MDDALLPKQTHASGYQNDGRLRTFALTGTGGIGKTDLALEFVYTRSSHFDGVFWLDAEEESQLSIDLCRIAEMVHLVHGAGPADIKIVTMTVKQWFEKGCTDLPASQQCRPWLVVFDNADDAQLLTNFIPSSGPGSILITSRDRSVSSLLSQNTPSLDVQPFADADGAALLHRLSKSDDSQQEVDASVDLASDLGCLPLALVQMAGLIRRRDLSLRESLKFIRDDARYATFRLETDPFQRRRYKGTLATAWNFDTLNDDCRALLNIISVLNSGRIQESLFEPIDEISSDRFCGIAHHVLQATDAFEDARAVLINSSVISRNRKRKEMNIHQMVAMEVRARMKPGELRATIYIAVERISRRWIFSTLEKRHMVERWSACEENLPHLYPLSKIISESSESWEADEDNYPVAALLYDAGEYLHERGFSFKGRAYCEQALALCKGMRSPSKRGLLQQIHFTLGAIANETNDGKACLEHTKVFLQMAQEDSALSGVVDIPLATAYSQLGIAYTMVDDLPHALQLFKESVSSLRSLPNVTVETVAFPVANLGLALWLLGELDEAEAVFKSALQEREIALGMGDAKTYKRGRLLHGYGNVLESRALKLEATSGPDANNAESTMLQSVSLHEEALQVMLAALGDYHHRVADLYHKLAVHRFRRSKIGDALAYIEKALAIWSNKPWYNNEVSRTTFLKGCILQKQGGAATIEGDACVEQASRMRDEILGNKTVDKPTDADFDKLVVFWSR